MTPPLPNDQALRLQCPELALRHGGGVDAAKHFVAFVKGEDVQRRERLAWILQESGAARPYLFEPPEIVVHDDVPRPTRAARIRTFIAHLFGG